MTRTIAEHEVRGAVERMAASATTPALPASAIIAAGARRRTRRRTGAAGAMVLAAALAVSATATTFGSSGGSSPAAEAQPPTTTNAFTEHLSRTLEQVLPGTTITARMFTDQNPAARHSRDDRFVLRIKTAKGSTDGFLILEAKAYQAPPDHNAAVMCTETLPWGSTRTGCIAKDLPGGGVLEAEMMRGPGSWDARMPSIGTDSKKTITIVSAELETTGTYAILEVRGGSTSNTSGISPEMLSAALADPRFTSYMADFSAHPETDPYGPLAPINETVVASGSVGTHTWTLSFAKVTEEKVPGFPEVTDNCMSWTYAVDGKSTPGLLNAYCSTTGSVVRNPAPTNKARPRPANQIHSTGFLGKPADVIATALTSTVPPGTASVEATFDNDPAKLSAKVFTVEGDVPYFAILKPDTAKPAWTLATVRCLGSDGKELGKLYFAAPSSLPPAR